MKLVILPLNYSSRAWHGLCFNNIMMTIKAVVGDCGLPKERDVMFLALKIGRRFI
jgi:hypothetical protein